MTRTTDRPQHTVTSITATFGLWSLLGLLNSGGNFTFQFRCQLPIFGDPRWLWLFLSFFELDQGSSCQEKILACMAKGIVLDKKPGHERCIVAKAPQ
jgi:hypothetical protein